MERLAMRNDKPAAGVPLEGAQRHARAELHRLQLEIDAVEARLGESSALKEQQAITCEIVRHEIADRRAREQLFGESLFSDPAWDILLELFVAQLTQHRIPKSQLSKAAVVPSTTALRWMDTLESSGWIRSHADPMDGRRIFVELTHRGSEVMARYFSRPRR